MSFRMAHLHGSQIPPHIELPVASGAAFEEGALLVVDSNGAYAECGANPATIAAVAEAAYGTDTTGYGKFGKREFPPGYMTAIPVANGQKFHARYIGTLPSAPGATYGVTRDTDGLWKVDFSKSAANQRVTLHEIDWTESPLNRNRVVVSVLAANVQVI